MNSVLLSLPLHTYTQRLHELAKVLEQDTEFKAGSYDSKLSTLLHSDLYPRHPDSPLIVSCFTLF